MELKEYSFAIFYLTALLCILTVFTAIFFDGVIASNTSTIIKRYVTNAAMIDSSVAETVQGAESACNGVSPSGINVLGGSVSTATSAIGLVVAIAFMMHLRYRLKDNYALFSWKEQVCLWMLSIPVIVEVIVYFFSYVNFKYYSNIYIVKLLKNMRIRADLQYLSNLWTKDRSKIESSGTTVNGACASNCLPAEERVDMMAKINSYLSDYNRMLDVDEWNNTTPGSLWLKISNLPSKTGTAFLILFVLIQCGYLWNMRIDNMQYAVAVLGVTTAFVVYLFLVKNYLTAADMDSVSSTYKTVFCQTGQDTVSAILKRDLTNQSSYANDSV